MVHKSLEQNSSLETEALHTFLLTLFFTQVQFRQFTQNIQNFRISQFNFELHNGTFYYYTRIIKIYSIA
jgi:uncharacterized protein YbcV (DUF1398 family)